MTVLVFSWAYNVGNIATVALTSQTTTPSATSHVTATLAASPPVSNSKATLSPLPIRTLKPTTTLSVLAKALTQVVFTIDQSYTTSAAAYRTDGTLVKTLWRKVSYPVGTHTATWDGTDDNGIAMPPGKYEIRVLYHNVKYLWEGVIGNTSKSFTGPTVHHAFLPIQSLTIDGANIFYAVGYNEKQSGGHRFNTNNPQSKTTVLKSDPFTSFNHVATDGVYTYWAAAAGCCNSNTRFVTATKVSDNTPVNFPNGQDICLNRFPEQYGGGCYPDQSWFGAIDVSFTGLGATGLAVQKSGTILAVSHSSRNQVVLFDKRTGMQIGSISIPSPQKLAFAPNGDLWAISNKSVLRYTNLSSIPSEATTIAGFSNPLDIAVHPANNDLILVADGGESQQVKAYNRSGSKLWMYGQAGGYNNGDPSVTVDKLWFGRGDEKSSIAVQSDGSFWVNDYQNNRVLHISASRTYLEQIAYQPHSYLTTIDLNNPNRVFSNFLEFKIDYSKSLKAGSTGAWVLVKNWAAGLPNPQYPSSSFDGLRTVVTLSNGRTYGLISSNDGSIAVVELPKTGYLRPTGIKLTSDKVLYKNGELSSASSPSEGVQIVKRLPLKGFDSLGNPQWEAENILASLPAKVGDPYYRGAFSGMSGPRFPVTSSGIAISLDQSVRGNTGFHLGGIKEGSDRWLWKASPTGQLDGRGTFQTQEIDNTINYGGNQVWADGRNVLYGFHGEFFTDPLNGNVGQANQFMHFYDDGLFVGQFGVPSTRATEEAQAGLGGNSFSFTLVQVGKNLYVYHNDESSHGGIHRWQIQGADNIQEMSGTGMLGEKINLYRGSN